MLVGYARTSTLEQEAGLEAQRRELASLGCERVFAEQTSSVGPRKALDEALEFVRSGDTFVVTKLDRLARSVPHMWEIVQHLQPKVGPCSTGDDEDGCLEWVSVPRRSCPGRDDAIGHTQVTAACTGPRDAELTGDALPGVI